MFSMNWQFTSFHPKFTFINAASLSFMLDVLCIKIFPFISVVFHNNTNMMRTFELSLKAVLIIITNLIVLIHRRQKVLHNIMVFLCTFTYAKFRDHLLTIISLVYNTTIIIDKLIDKLETRLYAFYFRLRSWRSSMSAVKLSTAQVSILKIFSSLLFAS